MYFTYQTNNKNNKITSGYLSTHVLSDYSSVDFYNNYYSSVEEIWIKDAIYHGSCSLSTENS